MTGVPPDDQPSMPSFVLASDEEARADIGPETPDNPVFVGVLFLNGTTQGWPVTQVRTLVTPESADRWGDFTEVGRLLTGCTITTRANAAVGDPDVVYVKYVTDVENTMQSLDEQIVLSRAVGTLVWRPEHGRWLVHHVGDYVRPEDVPHSL